jgi:hypothetical protein
LVAPPHRHHSHHLKPKFLRVSVLGEVEAFFESDKISRTMGNFARKSWLLMLQLVILRCMTTRGFSPGAPKSSSRTVSSRWIVAGERRVIVPRWMTSGGPGEENKETSNKNQAEGDPFAEYRNKNNVVDQVFSAMSKDGSIKVTACTARNMINDLMIQHSMTTVPTDALGRTVVCALLISNGMQAEQTLQLSFNCKC